MLDSAALTLLGNCAKSIVDGTPLHNLTLASKQAIEISYRDAYDAANAANGMSTRETLMLSMTLSNEREHSNNITGLVEKWTPDYGAIPESDDPETFARKVEEADALCNSYLADDLREYVEGLVEDAPNEVMAALIRCALNNVDWHKLARYYRED